MVQMGNDRVNPNPCTEDDWSQFAQDVSRTIQIIIDGGGGGDTYKVKVNSDDASPDYLWASLTNHDAFIAETHTRVYGEVDDDDTVNLFVTAGSVSFSTDNLTEDAPGAGDQLIQIIVIAGDYTLYVPMEGLRIRNGSGDELDAGSITSLDGDPVEDFDTINYPWPILESSAPDATKSFGVWLDPVDTGDNIVGRARASGIAVCEVNITNTEHGYAKAIDDDYTKLTSAEHGFAKLLKKETGSTGIQTCTVLLGGHGTPAVATANFAVVRSIGGLGQYNCENLEIGSSGGPGSTVYFLQAPDPAVPENEFEAWAAFPNKEPMVEDTFVEVFGFGGITFIRRAYEYYTDTQKETGTLQKKVEGSWENWADLTACEV